MLIESLLKNTKIILRQVWLKTDFQPNGELKAVEAADFNFAVRDSLPALSAKRVPWTGKAR